MWILIVFAVLIVLAIILGFVRVSWVERMMASFTPQGVIPRGETEPEKKQPSAPDGPLEKPKGTDWPRVRFALSMAIFGGTLGAAMVLINIITDVVFPEVPQFPSPFKSFIVAIPGVIAGMLLAAVMAYWVYGPPKTFRAQWMREPRSFKVWIALGVAFGIVIFLVMGAFPLPMSILFEDFVSGYMSIPVLLAEALDTLTSAPVFALLFGFRFIFTAALAGLVFGPGGWVIDRFSNSADAKTARFGPPLLTFAFSACIVVILLLVPETTLARLV